jgi:NADH-quinone oxidoreductase subunit C
MADPPTPPDAAGDKPAGEGPAEPLAGEVSRAGDTPVHSDAAGKPAPGSAAAGQAPPRPVEHVKTIAPPSGPPDPPPPADRPVPSFIRALQNDLPGAVEHVSYWVGDWTIVVSASRLVEAAERLRDLPGARFDFCSDVTASDWPPRARRFDVIYCLYSTRFRHRVRMKVRAGDGESVPSVAGIWPAANWLEREVFDLFGIRFAGHPDLRRILMPDEWQGHPQRKDYPLEGPGELLMESPLDWLKVKHSQEIE